MTRQYDRFDPHDFDLEPYVWYDPFELTERAFDMARSWHYREDNFRSDMRMAVASAHDHMYAIRRQNEKLMEHLSNATSHLTFPVGLPQDYARPSLNQQQGPDRQPPADPHEYPYLK